MNESSTWQGRAPRSVLDPFGPHGEPIATPLDRRWLWRIEGDLAASATNHAQRQLARDLHQYLVETCDHHWLHSDESAWRHPDTGEVEDVIPAHRQCLWCNGVEWEADSKEQQR